jgi:hypothetical protein
VLVAVHCYLLAQLLVPLRHFLYPGEVSWSEEGHRFAWHMKLRKKTSSVQITATDPATGRSWDIDPRADLRPRQIRKLQTFPDMMVRYVHHHRDRLHAEGVADPIIRVEWRCALNGAPPQLLIDPAVNLAAVDNSLWPKPWIRSRTR